MDFDLSEDQASLRDAAAALLAARHAPLDRLREWVGPGTLVGTLPGSGTPDREGAAGAAAATAAPTGFDGELWAAMAEQGWQGIERPEAAGGLGWGMVEVAVLCEQLGRHVAPAPYLPGVLAVDALGGPAAGGSGGLGPLVEALSSGDAVGCVALAAQGGPGGPGAGRVSVGGRLRAPTLTGTTDPVLYAPSSHVAVVVAEGAVYAVPCAGGAPWAAPEPAMDRTRELGRLVFDGTPAVPVGGPDAVARLFDRAATAMSAELLGVADHALALAVDHAKNRVQFGKPIGSFQAVKHRLADALVDVEGMRSTVYYAAWCCAAGDAEASLAASMAKSWCSDASRRVLSAALQVHGGIGFTWEHQLHWYLKRSQLDQVMFGDAARHRDRIAALLRERLEAGARIL